MKYKTLNDFYPEIALCLGKYVDDETVRIEKVLKQTYEKAADTLLLTEPRRLS